MGMWEKNRRKGKRKKKKKSFYSPGTTKGKTRETFMTDKDRK